MSTVPLSRAGPDPVVQDAYAAWLWLLAVPFCFVLGFAAGHLPYVWFDQVEGSPGPWWFELLVGALVIGVTWLPVGASLRRARRAVRAGHRWAWPPLVLDAVLTVAGVVVVVAAALA